MTCRWRAGSDGGGDGSGGGEHVPLGPSVGVEVGHRFETHSGSIDTQRPEPVEHWRTQDLPEGLGYGCCCLCLPAGGEQMCCWALCCPLPERDPNLDTSPG